MEFSKQTVILQTRIFFEEVDKNVSYITLNCKGLRLLKGHFGLPPFGFKEIVMVNCDI